MRFLAAMPLSFLVILVADCCSCCVLLSLFRFLEDRSLLLEEPQIPTVRMLDLKRVGVSKLIDQDQ